MLQSAYHPDHTWATAENGHIFACLSVARSPVSIVGANKRVLKSKGVSAWTLVYFLNWLNNAILCCTVNVFEKCQWVTTLLQTDTEVCDDTQRLNASRPSCRCRHTFPKINCRAQSTVCLRQHNRFYMATALRPLECTHAVNATRLAGGSILDFILYIDR